MQHRLFRLAVVLVGLAMFAGACGGGGGVGKGLSVKNGQGGSGAIGQATTTTQAPTTTAPKTVTTVKPVATTAPVPAAVYTIQNDTKGQYIDPLSHTVRAGSLVRFVNQDNIAHNIEGKLGSTVGFASPSIAPGASWDVSPTTRGNYDIVDDQRPYAQGATLTVG